jgi:DNA-binding CsgD family transcriptional regulator
MSSIAVELPVPKRLRVALQLGDPLRRKSLADGLRGSGFVIENFAADADVVLSDETLPASSVPSVVFGDLSNTAGLLPLNASFEQIEAAIRAVAAGLVVRPPGSEPMEFQSQTDLDEGHLLTPRELQVLDAIAAGLTNKGIARQLGISLHTVKFHVESVFRKLGARTRTEAVAKGLERRRTEMISV